MTSTNASHDWRPLKCKWTLPILQDALDAIVRLREADVLVHHRFCIDRDVRCGQWYAVSAKVKLLSSRPPFKAFLLFLV